MPDDLAPASGVLPIVQKRMVVLAQLGFCHLYRRRDEVRPDRLVAVSPSPTLTRQLLLTQQ
jgi:hypothetical protein